MDNTHVFRSYGKYVLYVGDGAFGHEVLIDFEQDRFHISEAPGDEDVRARLPDAQGGQYMAFGGKLKLVIDGGDAGVM